MPRPLLNRVLIPVVLAVCWTSLAAVWLAAPEAWPVLVVAFGSLVVTITAAALYPALQLFGPAVVRGVGADGVVALTFDDGPDPVFTPRILDQLDAAGARATFFVVGEQVRRAPEVARAILERGHQVAHHGDAHRWQLIFTPGRLAADYVAAADSIQEATGRLPALFRPPVGIIAPETMDMVRAAGVRLAAWSLRPRDGTLSDPVEVRRRVSSKIRAGDIVLLHDAARHGRWDPPAVAALPGILEDLQQRGLRSVTLSELTGQPAYLPEDEAMRPTGARRSPVPMLVAATLALLLGSFAAHAFADEPQLPPTLLEAAAELAKSSTVEASFLHVKSSVLFVEPVRSNGRLSIRRRDNRIVWEYDDGVAILVFDGRVFPAGKAASELTAEEAAGVPMPGGDGLGEMMGALFTLDQAALGRHFTGRDLGEGRFELTPRSDRARSLFVSVVLEIGGAPLALRSVEIHEATGDSTTVAFTDVVQGADLPDERFQTPAERSAGPK